MPDDISTFITSVQTYLKQQEEEYGSVLYPDPPPGIRQARDMSSRKKNTAASQSAAELFPLESEEPTGDDWEIASTLAELNPLICECQKCPLGQTRTNFVFGVGNPDAQAVLIGEAPGADEDLKGEPFVGRAGQLLTKILEAINFKREDVFICNILKCRPPGNRDPLSSEVEQCEPYLHKQLEIIKPKIILALGRIAAQTLLRTNDSLSRLRERTHIYQGIPLIATFHPAAILRNPNWKRPTWDDVQKFRRLYDELTTSE